jgi:hypothetical protein
VYVCSYACRCVRVDACLYTHTHPNTQTHTHTRDAHETLSTSLYMPGKNGYDGVPPPALIQQVLDAQSDGHCTRVPVRERPLGPPTFFGIILYIFYPCPFVSNFD